MKKLDSKPHMISLLDYKIILQDKKLIKMNYIAFMIMNLTVYVELSLKAEHGLLLKILKPNFLLKIKILKSIITLRFSTTNYVTDMPFLDFKNLKILELLSLNLGTIILKFSILSPNKKMKFLFLLLGFGT